jgi:hypothetical protein
MSGSDAEPGSVSAELAALQVQVGTPAYWRNEGGIQDRYRELVTARQTHTAAPPAQSSAATKEIAAIERTLRERPHEYWRSPEMQDRYRALTEARLAATAPVGNDVIGAKPPAPPAKAAKGAKTDAYRELLAANDRKLAPAATEEWRLTPDAARATLPDGLVAEWSDAGNYAGRLARAQDAFLLIAQAIGDPAAVEEMRGSFSSLPNEARRSVVRELGGAAPAFCATATAVELAAFRKEMPGAVWMERGWGRETARRVGVAAERFNRMLTGAALDRPQLQAWWDRAPPIERAGIFYALGSLT